MSMELQGTTTKTTYFSSLNIWLQHLKTAQIMTNYMVLMNTFNFGDQNQPPRVRTRPRTRPIPRHRFDTFRVVNAEHQREIIRLYGGVEMLIAPFWRRVLAEILDMLIVFGLKLIVTFMYFQRFDVDFDKSALSRTIHEDNPLHNLFNKSLDIGTVSYDLMANILMTKFIACLYECVWTTCFQGATVGKSLMSLRICYVEAVVPLHHRERPLLFFHTRHEPLQAILYPCETPTMMRSIMRAVIKNIILTAFFPICALLVFLKNNRTTYDVITKTVVIENHRVQRAQH